MTCDKQNLNRFILKVKKRLDEACAVLDDGRRKQGTVHRRDVALRWTNAAVDRVFEKI